MNLSICNEALKIDLKLYFIVLWPRWPTIPVKKRTEISQAKFVPKVISNVNHPLHIYTDAEVTDPHGTHRHKRTWIAKSV